MYVCACVYVCVCVCVRAYLIAIKLYNICQDE